MAVKSKAFTIVELMVVIFIISGLVGLLLPALGRVRAVAKQTVCKSRLRQWGLAFEAYAAQNDGYYPHIDGRDRTSSNPVTEADRADYFYGWVDVLAVLMGQKSWRDYPYWQKPGRKTIFQCPSARLAPDRHYKYRPRRTGYFSYAMNSCLELDENCWHNPDEPGENMPSFLKTSLIHRAERVVLVFDQLLDPSKGYDAERVYKSAGKHCGSYPKAFSARHSKIGGTLGGLILYCDYHVEWKETVWKSDWPDDLEVPPRSDYNWYPYP